MKTSLCIIITFVLGSLQFSKGQCELRTDPISGKQERSFDFNNKSIYFSSTDGENKLELKFNFNGELNEYIPKGKSIHIKLSNDTILNLQTENDATPVSTVIAPNIFSQYTFKMALSEKELQQLASQEAVFIRYPGIGDSNVDLDLNKTAKKLRKNLQTGAACIAGN